MSGIFAEGGRVAWAQYTKVLEELVGPTGANTRVQPLSVAEIATWDTVHTHYNHCQQGKLADRLGQWAAVGSFTGRSVSSGYLEFLKAIQREACRTLPATDRAALEAASRNVERRRSDARSLAGEISRLWGHHRRDMDAGRVPFSTLRQFEEQRGFRLLRDRISRAVEDGQRDYDSIARRIGGDVVAASEALAQYYAAGNGVALPEHPEDDQPGLSDTWPVFLNQRLERDIATFKGETRRLKLTLAAGCAQSAGFATRWDDCLGVSFPFWGVSGGVAGASYDERTSRETRSVTIYVENIASFGVWRGNWYRPALIDAYGAKARSAWGRDGYFNVIPTAFILVRGVTVTAAIPSEEKTYVQRTFDAGGAIRIGPFNFGGGGASATIQSTCETTGTGLKIVDTSGRALIVGLAALCPAPGSSCG